jgi:hypothetical protein
LLNGENEAGGPQSRSTLPLRRERARIGRGCFHILQTAVNEQGDTLQDDVKTVRSYVLSSPTVSHSRERRNVLSSPETDYRQD